MNFPKPAIVPFPKTSFQAENKFSILIPSWNNLEMLQLCIQSIHKNSAFKHQIVVHVNEGVDGTLEWIQAQNIDYTHSSSNAGVCYAINALAELANTKYILFLNDDMYVCPDWDLHLWNEAMAMPHNKWYLSGTMIEPSESANPCNIAPYNFGKEVNTFKENELLTFTKTLHRKNWLGASWPPSLVPKELFLKAGGYSEEFSPGMYSDPDFSMKLWQQGVRDFKGIAASMVYHFQSKSTGRVKRNDGRKQFAQKWGIPASYFYKSVLKLGQDFSADESLELKKNLAYYFAKLRAFFIANK